MTLDELEAALARLLTDAAWRDMLFDAPPDAHAHLSLSPAVFATMRRLDRRRLHATGEGFQGKRFERIESAFPRTLALLDRWAPAARSDYLACTRFPRSDGEERALFLGFLRTLDAPADLARLLGDLAVAELAAYGLETGASTEVETEGHLGAALSSLHHDAVCYPPRPSRVRVERGVGGIRFTDAAWVLPTMIS